MKRLIDLYEIASRVEALTVPETFERANLPTIARLAAILRDELHKASTAKPKTKKRK